MSTFKHTAGPWKYHRAPGLHGGYVHIIQAGKVHGVTILTIIAGANSDRVDEVCHLNAERIVACVNACEGFETADLVRDPTTIRQTVDKLPEVILHYPELEAAARSILALLKRPSPFNAVLPNDLARLDWVLKRIEAARK
jgi:hypothetical protein